MANWMSSSSLIVHDILATLHYSENIPIAHYVVVPATLHIMMFHILYVSEIPATLSTSASYSEFKGITFTVGAGSNRLTC